MKKLILMVILIVSVGMTAFPQTMPQENFKVCLERAQQNSDFPTFGNYEKEAQLCFNNYFQLLKKGKELSTSERNKFKKVEEILQNKLDMYLAKEKREVLPFNMFYEKVFEVEMEIYGGNYYYTFRIFAIPLGADSFICEGSDGKISWIGKISSEKLVQEAVFSEKEVSWTITFMGDKKEISKYSDK